jgi:hypothetical protein
MLELFSEKRQNVVTVPRSDLHSVGFLWPLFDALQQNIASEAVRTSDIRKLRGAMSQSGAALQNKRSKCPTLIWLRFSIPRKFLSLNDRHKVKFNFCPRSPLNPADARQPADSRGGGTGG